MTECRHIRSVKYRHCLQVSSARHGVAVATRDNASLRAVAKQQRQRSDSGGSARFTAESHGVHVAGARSASRLSVISHAFSEKPLKCGLLTL